VSLDRAGQELSHELDNLNQSSTFLILGPLNQVGDKDLVMDSVHQVSGRPCKQIGHWYSFAGFDTVLIVQTDQGFNTTVSV